MSFEFLVIFLVLFVFLRQRERERELLFINLEGCTVYRGSSLRVRIIVELTRMGYSYGFGVGGLECSSKKCSGSCIDESDNNELGE